MLYQVEVCSNADCPDVDKHWIVVGQDGVGVDVFYSPQEAAKEVARLNKKDSRV